MTLITFDFFKNDGNKVKGHQMKSSHFEAITLGINESTLELGSIDGKDTYTKTDEWDIATQVKFILRVAYLIQNTKETKGFLLIQGKNNGKQHIEMTSLGKEVHDAFRANISVIQSNFDKFQFHPLLQLTIKIGIENSLFDEARRINSSRNGYAKMLVNLFNGCIEQIHNTSNSKEFKEQARNFERNSKENSKKFNEYIDAHFAKRSRLLFIRIDLSYLEAYIEFIDHDAATIYTKLRNDWKILHKDLNRKIFKKGDFLGFAWKLEYGIKKSFHLHVLLILNSSTLMSDGLICKIVGDHWSRVVTKGSGSYFNCNSKKNSYRFCGIGQIHRNDAEKRAVLHDRVGVYMTKADYVLSLQVPDQGRAFGKGNMPK